MKGDDIIGEVFGESSNKKAKREFKETSTDGTLDKMSKKIFAPKSRRKIRWVVNMYNEWRRCRVNDVNCPVEIR